MIYSEYYHAVLALVRFCAVCQDVHYSLWKSGFKNDYFEPVSRRFSAKLTVIVRKPSGLTNLLNTRPSCSSAEKNVGCVRLY